jgi:hypothetical protein
MTRPIIESSPPRTRRAIARRRADLRDQRRLTNEEATRTAFEKQIDTVWREQFEQGDREKLLVCFAFCVRTGRPIPSWVAEALAEIFDRWFQAKDAPRNRSTMDDLIFGQRRAS